MSKTVHWCILIVSMGVWVLLSLIEPVILSDKNKFLLNFVNHELLAVLGVIVAITLASAANLHLEFNRIEDAAKATILVRTRNAVRLSAFSMIALFVLAILVVVLKGYVKDSDLMFQSFLNGGALLIVLFNVLVLTDLTQLVFKIPPLFKIVENETKPPKTGKS